ncbi:MAG: hypothetical protein EPO21_20035 [Chloroflexota bacterium]|nr:MAG: hypothetical protein EPO21_20035 [Chloroflexota bacterium]
MPVVEGSMVEAAMRLLNRVLVVILGGRLLGARASRPRETRAGQTPALPGPAAVCEHVWFGRLLRQSTRPVQHLRQQPGQAIVMVALSMVFIAGFLALTLDAGYAYSQRRKMQNAADAAAQAAARLLALNSACYGTPCPPYSDGDITDAITSYVSQNQGSVDFTNDPPVYVDSSGHLLTAVGTGTIPSAAAGTVITTTSTFPSFFAAVLSHTNLSVQGRSSALLAVSQMQSVTRPRDLVPLVVPLQDFLANQTAEWNLWGPQYGQGYNLPANYKALVNLNLGSGPGYTPGVSCPNVNACLEQWSQFGFDGTVGNDNIIPIVNGDRSLITDELIVYCQSQLRSDAGGSYGLFKMGIFNSFDPASGNVHISGFAQFKVYCSTIGNSMSGRFESYIAPGSRIVEGGDVSVPGPRVVVFVDPFSGLPGGPLLTATATPPGGAPTATRTATPTTTSTSVPTGTPISTSTPTATPVSGTPTATPSGPTATPTITNTPGPTATATPRAYTVVWWGDAQYSTVSRGATNFACAAGNATAGPINWTSHSPTSLYFVIWPADQPAPTSSEVTHLVDSGESFGQFLPSAGTYTVYAYDAGTNSNKNATISAFTVTCR